MRRTKEEALETRHAILVASRKLFVENGYATTTLEDIASAAGFTRGAVHWHFQNKAGVLKALREEETSPMQQLLGKLTIDTTLDPFAALDGTIRTFFGELTDQPEKRQLLRVMFQETLSAQPDTTDVEVGQSENDVMKMTCSILKYAEQRGLLARPWTPESAALAFQSLVKGIISSWLSGTAMFDLATEGVTATSNFLESLRKK